MQDGLLRPKELTEDLSCTHGYAFVTLVTECPVAAHHAAKRL
jgi:hypothetical protein